MKRKKVYYIIIIHNEIIKDNLSNELKKEEGIKGYTINRFTTGKGTSGYISYDGYGSTGSPYTSNGVGYG